MNALLLNRPAYTDDGLAMGCLISMGLVPRIIELLSSQSVKIQVSE